jgi:beta-glucosidase
MHKKDYISDRKVLQNTFAKTEEDSRRPEMELYQDPKQNYQKRAADLLKRMTIDEKLAQLLHPWEKKDDEKIVEKHGALGVGFLYTFWVNDPDTVQRKIMEKSRLKIPVAFVQEAHHSGAAGGTIFPSTSTLSMSWDPELVERVQSVIAYESRALNVRLTYSPNIDVHTDPRFGRVEEGFGEDPLLTSRMAAASVRGLQGGKRWGETLDGDHIAAVAKHFAAYGRTENGQDGSAADLSERTLREIYLPPFKAAVEAGTFSIMPAHNEINGVPCHANRMLLTAILRGEWGFGGLVIGDYSDSAGLCGYGIAKDPEHAARLCISAGLDIDMGAKCFDTLKGAVEAGRIKIEIIDRAVLKCLEYKFLLGLFEQPFSAPGRKAELDCAEHRSLAREAAEKSITLLKNDKQALPLSKKLKKIAVLGALVEDEKAYAGGYSQFGAKMVMILEGIRNAVGPAVELIHKRGCEVMKNDPSLIAEAVEAAKQADVAIIVAGDSAETCRESWGGTEGDRHELDLPGSQLDLIKAVHATGKPVVVVLINGRPQSMPWVVQNIPAIVAAWRPGEEGGNAIARILFGEVNPSGKLTFNVVRSVGHLPLPHYLNKRQYAGRKLTFLTPEESGPLHPFGFGLSYTQFEYTNLRLHAERIPLDGAITVKVDVRNAGGRDGDEIVQVYACDMLSSVVRPMRKLVDFKRVTIKVGETRTVEFVIEATRFAFHDINMKYGVEPGAFTLYVGADSAAPLSAVFAIGDDADVTEGQAKYYDSTFVPTPDNF